MNEQTLKYREGVENGWNYKGQFGGEFFGCESGKGDGEDT